MNRLRALLTTLMFFCVASAFAQQTPWTSNAPIPGLIQAENYDRGGEGVAWHDTSAGNVFGVYRFDDMDVGAIPAGGYHIGFVDTAEWAEYTVNVATTGQYQVRLRVASANPTASNLHLEMGGVNVSGTQSVNPTGDWQAYVIQTFNVFLSAGDGQILRIAFDTGSVNLDSIEFVSLAGVLPCSTNSAAPTPAYVPCEFTAVASGTGLPSNPYAGMDAFATVTPPANVTFNKRLRGFWVGPGPRFKFRFTPTASGAWTVNFSSDASHATAFSGEAPRTFYAGASGSSGFLRRDTTSQFTDRFVRDDGSHPFIWGTTYYQIVNNVRAVPAPTDVNHWTRAINGIKAYGVNKVRLLVYPWWGAYSGFPGVDSQPYGGPARTPCADAYTDPATKLSKCPNYDSLDTAHFDALDKVVDYLYTNGMIADVILFKDPGDPDDNFRTFGDTLTQDQRLAQYIVARYAAYPNVTFCLSNEWENTINSRGGTPTKDYNYWNAMGDLVRTEDPYYYNPVTGRFRILTIHHKSAPVWDSRFILAQTENLGWLVSAELQWGVRNKNYNGQENLKPDKWGTDILGGQVNYGGTSNRTAIPVIDEEFGYLGDHDSQGTLLWPKFNSDTRKAHRQAVWGLATAGLFGTLGDVRTNPQAVMSAIWADAANEYGDLKRMIDFFTASRGAFTISNYWQMRRNYSVFGNKLRRVYALSDSTNNQIVIYDAEGTGFNATLPAGKTYSVYSYNPSVNAAVGSQPYGAPILTNAAGTVFITTPGQRDTVILCIAQ